MLYKPKSAFINFCLKKRIIFHKSHWHIVFFDNISTDIKKKLTINFYTFFFFVLREYIKNKSQDFKLKKIFLIKIIISFFKKTFKSFIIFLFVIFLGLSINYSLEFCGTKGGLLSLFNVSCSVALALAFVLLFVVLGSAAVAALTDISSSCSFS